MQTTVPLLLSILQLVLCGKSLLVAEYNCSTDGIPAVAVVAGQGHDNPSVQFFLPLFDNCSVAEVWKPAQLAAGGWSCDARAPLTPCRPYFCRQCCTTDSKLFGRSRCDRSERLHWQSTGAAASALLPAGACPVRRHPGARRDQDFQ
jgi:hypothetical protein